MPLLRNGGRSGSLGPVREIAFRVDTNAREGLLRCAVWKHGCGLLGYDNPFDFNQQFPATEITLEIENPARRDSPEGLLDDPKMLRLTDVHFERASGRLKVGHGA